VSNSQSQLVKTKFLEQNGEPLPKFVKSKTSGDYKDALIALMDELPAFCAKRIKRALKAMVISRQ